MYLNLEYIKRVITICFFLTLTFSSYALAQALNYPTSIAQLAPNNHAKINTRAYQQLSKAQTLAQKNKPKAALNILEKLLTRYAKNPYIVSLALRSAAWLFIADSQTKEAIKLISLTIKLDSLDRASMQSLIHLQAQLYYQAEQYQASIKTLKQWLKSTKTKQATRDDYYLLALAAYQLSNYPSAINAAKQGLAKAHNDETLLQLIAQCQLRQKHYPQAAKTLANLLEINPQHADYWSQQTAVQLYLKQPDQALVTLELMAANHLLSTERLRRQYIQLLAHQKNPERAARILADYLDKALVITSAETTLQLSRFWHDAGDINQAIKVLANVDNQQQNEAKFKQWRHYLNAVKNQTVY